MSQQSGRTPGISPEPSFFSTIFAFLGWSYLPSLATSTLQSIYYKVTVRAGTPHPQPGTPRFARDHRRIRILVLCLYLLYTLLQCLYDIKLEGDFFTILGVSPYNITDREIRSKFRRLAAKFHPDKLHSAGAGVAGQTTSFDDVAGASNTLEAHFLSLKLAQDTLLSPNLRYAYTHFGPRITTLNLPNPSSTPISTYVYSGLRQMYPTYLFDFSFLVLLNYFFLPKAGQFWRYLIMAASVLLEFYLVTHDTDLSLSSVFPAPWASALSVVSTTLGFVSPPQLRDVLPPHLLPFQLLRLSRKMNISLNIFISQISSLTSPDAATSAKSVSALQAQQAQFLSQLTQNLTNLSQLAARTDQESTGILRQQLAPFKGDADRVASLRAGMREGMITAIAKSSPDVAAAVTKAVRKRIRENERASPKYVNNSRVTPGEGVDQDGAEVVDLLNSDVQL